MYKRTSIFILIFAISSLAGLKSVAASTDCDRWLKQYQEQLANQAAVKKAIHHVHHLMHATQPKKPVRVAAIPPVHKPVVPKLTPAEMLKRFHVLCDTPEEEVETQPAMVGGFVPALLAPPPTEIATGIVPPLPGMPIMSTQPVQPVSPILPPAPIGAPILPGIPVTPSQPISTVPPPVGTPITPSQPIDTVPPPTGTPITPSQPITPVAPTPEPSSLLLVLTGAAGLGARVFRSRKNS